MDRSAHGGFGTASVPAEDFDGVKRRIKPASLLEQQLPSALRGLHHSLNERDAQLALF